MVTKGDSSNFCRASYIPIIPLLQCGAGPPKVWNTIHIHRIEYNLRVTDSLLAWLCMLMKNTMLWNPQHDAKTAKLASYGSLREFSMCSVSTEDSTGTSVFPRAA